MKRVKAVFIDEATPCTLDVDYNEAAAKLENIFKLSPVTEDTDMESKDGRPKRGQQRRKKSDKRPSDGIVRNQTKRIKRLDLDRRIALKSSKEGKAAPSLRKQKDTKSEADEIDDLVRDYSASTDLVSLDWKKMKIPPVLPSSEHTRLFKLVQPMKVRLKTSDVGNFLE